MNTNEEGNCRRRFWKFPVIVLAVILIKSGLVMVLWNALIPDLFHGPLLNYLQALEMTVLVKLLTGFGGRHWGGHHRHWKKWHSLSPEEREKLREEYRKRCGD
jgi:hypothetical protein